MRILTAKDDRFIRKHYKKLSSREIGEKLGVARQTVMSFLRREKLRVPRRIALLFKQRAILAHHSGVVHPADELIREFYLLMPLKTMAELIGRSGTYVKDRMQKLKLKVPRVLIDQWIEESRIKPGAIPANKGKKQTEFMSPEAIAACSKTRFKKGQKIWNEAKDGEIRVRHDHPDRSGGRPIKYIRMAKGKWKELQIHNWEKKHGPIPKGFLLACKDGNTLNCRPSNWELLSMKENYHRNSASLNLTDRYVANTIVGKNKQHLKEAVLQRPELIELKRQSIILNRTINEKRGKDKAA